jgi:hypothetical protein
MTVVELSTAPGDMGRSSGGKDGRLRRCVLVAPQRACHAGPVGHTRLINAQLPGPTPNVEVRVAKGGSWELMDWDQMVLVGRIARPHGLRGRVIVAGN